MIETNKGQNAMIMGCPMGAADYTTGDFQAVHPESGQTVLFGIDPEEAVTLTVVNEYDQEVEHKFQAGANSYLIKTIKQDADATVTVNYFI